MAFLIQALRQSADAARTQKELRAIFAAGIHEIARQISTGHDGRGGLLMNVWSCAEELHAHVLEQRDSQVQRLSEDCARLAAELRTVRAKLGSVAGLETSHYSQAAELHRVQHSRNQLAATSESLQASLTLAEEQLRASEAGRLALHAKLSNEGEGAAAQYEARIASLQRQLAQARAEGHELRE